MGAPNPVAELGWPGCQCFVEQAARTHDCTEHAHPLSTTTRVSNPIECPRTQPPLLLAFSSLIDRSPSIPAPLHLLERRESRRLAIKHYPSSVLECVQQTQPPANINPRASSSPPPFLLLLTSPPPASPSSSPSSLCACHCLGRQDLGRSRRGLPGSSSMRRRNILSSRTIGIAR